MKLFSKVFAILVVVSFLIFFIKRLPSRTAPDYEGRSRSTQVSEGGYNSESKPKISPLEKNPGKKELNLGPNTLVGDRLAWGTLDEGAGGLGPQSQLTYSLWEGDRKISQHAIDEIGLTQSEVEDLQEYTNSLFDKADTLVATSIRKDPGRTNPAQNQFAFIMPSSEEGKGLLQEFKRHIQARFDRKKSALILSAASWRHYYGLFFNTDSSIVITKNPDQQGGYDVSITPFHPVTSDRMGSSQGPLSEFKQKFGGKVNLLEF